MSEVVDSIIAELIVRDNGYVSGFEAATKAANDHTAALKRMQAADAKSGQPTRGRATAAQSDAAVIKRAAKETADAEKAAAKAAADAVKSAEKEKQAALKATAREQAAAAKAATAAAEAEKAASAAAIAAAEREAATRARLAAVAERAVAGKGVARGTGKFNTSGYVVQPGDRVAPSSIPAASLAGDGSVAAETEINHLLADQATLQSRLAAANGRDRDIIRDKLAEMRLIKQLQAAGLDDAAIAVKLDERALAIEAERAAVAKRQARSLITKDASRFAEGAGIGRSYGSFATVGGIVAASTVASIAELAKKGLEYAQSLEQDSDQLGLTTRDLQLYQRAALEAGLTTEQLKAAFSALSSNIGKAQGGDKQLSRVFGIDGLNVDLGNAKDGFKNLSAILPTLSDRLSKIPDQTKRFALETAIGGESLRKLDPILSQGAGSFDKWAQSVQAAGGILSDSDIQKSDETAKKISLLNDQLQTDLASTVAQNADSILGLAKAFLALADGALKAFSAVSNANALFSLNHPTLTAIGNFGTGKSVAQSDNEYRQQLLGNHSGRQSLFTRNTNALNELSRAAKNGGLNDELPGFYDVGLKGLADNPQAIAAARKQLLQFRQKIRQEEKIANAPPPAPAVQPGSPGSGSVFSPESHEPRGKSAATLENERIERERRFNDQLAQYQDEQLRDQEGLTGDIAKRAQIEKQLADRALEREQKDIEYQTARDINQGEDPKLAQARETELKAAAQKAHDLQIQGIEQQTAFDLARAQNDTDQRILQQKADHLNNELSLATTSAERRKIELELLATAEAQQRKQLEGVIATNPKDSPQVADANAQLKALPAQFADQRETVMRQTETSLDAYKRTLKVTSDTISDFGVHALEGFNGALDDSITKALHLHGVFGQIIGDLIDMAIKQEIIGPLSKSGGFSSVLSAIGSAFGIGGGGGVAGTGFNVGSIDTGISFGGFKASGGPVDPSKGYVVGEHGREWFQPNVAGTIIPNHALIAPMAGNVSPAQHMSGPTQIVLHVQSNDYFDARVHSISSAVAADTSVRVVRAAAPAIQKGAINAAPARVQRMQTLGS